MVEKTPEPYVPSDMEAIVQQCVETILWSTPDPDGPIGGVQDAEARLAAAVESGDHPDELDDLRWAVMLAKAKVEDGHGEHLDEFYGPGDIDPATMADIRADLYRFVLDPDNGDALRAYVARVGNENWIGHDFALTRDGHGTGFWDCVPADIGRHLTDACKSYGESDLHPGDDGKLYVSGAENGPLCPTCNCKGEDAGERARGPVWTFDCRHMGGGALNAHDIAMAYVAHTY